MASRCCLRIIDFFAISFPPPSSGDERGAHEPQELASFLVGLGGGADGNVHAAQLLDLVVLDLGEDDLLADAEAVVAAAVESVGGDAAEVADTRQGHVEEPVEEATEDTEE